jgi:hypothetical protein
MQRSNRRSSKIGRGAGVALTGLLLVGCDSEPFGLGRTLFQVALVPVAGDEQVVPDGGVESAPLVVRVVDQRGTVYPDQTVEWRIVKGGGTLSAASSRTDANGQARVTYISGDAAASVEVTATVAFSIGGGGPTAGRPVDPVRFRLTVTQPAGSAAVDDA